MESFTTSKPDCHLLTQKILQRISVIPENWHFNSRFVLKPTNTAVFVFIPEILWWTFWCNVWRSVFDTVKDSSFWYPNKNPFWASQVSRKIFRIRRFRIQWTSYYFFCAIRRVDLFFAKVVAKAHQEQKQFFSGKPFLIRRVDLFFVKVAAKAHQEQKQFFSGKPFF